MSGSDGNVSSVTYSSHLDVDTEIQKRLHGAGANRFEGGASEKFCDEDQESLSYVIRPQLVSFSGAQTKSAEKTGLEESPREIKVEGYECNVAEETSVKEVFEDIVQNFGRIDSVIASAG